MHHSVGVHAESFFFVVVFLVFVQVKLHPPVLNYFIHYWKAFLHSCTMYFHCHHEVLENFGKLSLTLQGHGHEWSFSYGFVDGVHLQIEMRMRRLEKFTRTIDKCRSS